MTLRRHPSAFAQYRCSYTSGLNVVIYVKLCCLVHRNLCWHCMSTAGPPLDCNYSVLWNCAASLVFGFDRQSKQKHQDIFFWDVTPCILVVGTELYSKCSCTLVHDGPGFDYRQEQRVSSPKGHTYSGASHPASYPIDNRILSRGWGRRENALGLKCRG